ncbi:MAG: Hachiman antiphage defense system protein HamA, partial [Saccharofermentanales bacterium]
LDAMERRRELLNSLRIANALLPQSPYPQNAITQKANFAEIFLAEYLHSTTEAQIPVYRLRYNPNVEQSMKGDDVLLFDMDSEPVRIIVGEAKFRGTPSKQVVLDIVEGLIRSNRIGLPVSLMFVADRLFEERKYDLAKKVQNCALLFATNLLKIDYVGLLMSNHNASNPVNTHTTNELRNLLMISLKTQSPDAIVQQAFMRLEGLL